MATITKISIQQKNKDRFNIFLDEKYAFSVDADVLIKHELKKGMEVDEVFLSEIAYDDEVRKAYNSAIHYLARRMRSEFEVRNHLLEKEYGAAVINEVIHKLYDYKFLNDEDFAISFVRTLMNTTDKGPVLVKKDLEEKGISPKIIEQVMLLFDYDTQLEKAITLGQKYANKNKKDAQMILIQKVEQYLVRKGYPFSIMKEALKELSIEKEEEEHLMLCRAQAEKFARKYRAYEGFEWEMKMKQALYRKGFPMEIIEDVLRNWEEN